jgi:hypothetical protein
MLRYHRICGQQLTRSVSVCDILGAREQNGAFLDGWGIGTQGRVSGAIDTRRMEGRE